MRQRVFMWFCVRFIKRSLHWNVSPFYVGQHDLEIASYSFIYMILYKLAHIQFIRSFARLFACSFVRESLYTVCIKINWSISHGTIARTHTHTHTYTRRTHSLACIYIMRFPVALSLPLSHSRFLSFRLTFPSNFDGVCERVWLSYIVFMCARARSLSLSLSRLFPLSFQRFVPFSREVFFFSAMICCRYCCFRRFICHAFSVRI